MVFLFSRWGEKKRNEDYNHLLNYSLPTLIIKIIGLLFELDEMGHVQILPGIGKSRIKQNF